MADTALTCFTETRDPDDLTEFIGPLVEGAVFTPASGRGLYALIVGRRLAQSTILSIRLDDGRARIPSGRDFISLTIPMWRGFDLRQGRRLYHLECGYGHVAPCHVGVEFRPETGSHLVALNLDYALLAAHAAEPGMSRDDVLDWLPVQVDLRKHAGARFMRAFSSVLEGLPETIRSRASTRFFVEVQSELSSLFIEACRDQAGEPSREKVHLARGDRAEEYLRASLTEPVCLAEVAAAAEVSVRTLTRLFAHRYGMGPMRYLRTLRLDAAHRALLIADPGERSVTEIATSLGFTHFGRFAGQYRQRFGERPSDTLNCRTPLGRRTA